jgi:hypothetical protein
VGLLILELLPLITLLRMAEEEVLAVAQTLVGLAEVGVGLAALVLMPQLLW